MDLLEYECPNCGVAIQFDPGAQVMVCPYCRSEISLEALKSMDEAMAQSQAQGPLIGDTRAACGVTASSRARLFTRATVAEVK